MTCTHRSRWQRQLRLLRLVARGKAGTNCTKIKITPCMALLPLRNRGATVRSAGVNSNYNRINALSITPVPLAIRTVTFCTEIKRTPLGALVGGKWRTTDDPTVLLSPRKLSLVERATLERQFEWEFAR
jgi:hypothetical protein